MNPLDYMILLASLGLAAAALGSGGPTWNGIGPAILFAFGGLWQFWLQWLRRRSWRRHRGAGSAPGTSHLGIAAALGWFLAVCAAASWVMLTASRNR